MSRFTVPITEKCVSFHSAPPVLVPFHKGVSFHGIRAVTNFACRFNPLKALCEHGSFWSSAQLLSDCHLPFLPAVGLDGLQACLQACLQVERKDSWKVAGEAGGVV